MKTIEFFTTVPGLTETYPIKEAKDVIPGWVESARVDYLKANKRDPHIVRCPGIFEMFGNGFIVSMWHDVEITTNNTSFTYTVPDNKLNEMLGKDVVQIQHESGVARFLPKRPWSCKSILKINTPWHVMAPKGMKFLMLPLAYSDQFDFESCIGILDPSISSEINIQGYWNVPVGTKVLKAGTPIAQLIPITESKIKAIVRDMNEKDKKWIDKRSYLNFFSFILNRTKVKEAYNTHNSKSKCPFHFWK